MPDGRGSSSGPLLTKGKVIQGMGGCSQYSGSEVLHQRLRRRHRQAAVEVPHRGQGRRAGRRHVGRAVEHLPRRRRNVDHRQLRPRAEPDVLGHRAGQAVDAGQPRDVHAGQGALHQLHGGARRRHRQAGLALPARARRSAGSRHRLRARAGGFRRPEPGLHRRQGRHPVEAGSQDRPLPRAQGDAVPERLGKHRRPHRPAASTARTSSTPRWANGSTAAPARKADTTGRR